VAETTPGRSDHAACQLTATRIYFNSLPEAPQNWGHIDPNLNDYHSERMEISSTFWLPDITDSWRQQKETHFKYTNLSNVARDISSIIPHGVWVEASFSLARNVIGLRRSMTKGKNLQENAVVRQFARANNSILASADPELDRTNTENDSEMKKAAEERTFHRMAKVHDFLEMWQGSQNLCTTHKESRAQNKRMTAVGYISDTEAIVKASWSLFQHNGEAALKLSGRSPWPPPLSAKDLPGGQTQILNAHRFRRINCHPVESNEDSAPESISDTEDWLNRKGDLENPNDSEDDCAADVESDIEQHDSIEDLECLEQRDLSAVPYVSGLIGPTQKSKRQAGRCWWRSMQSKLGGIREWRKSRTECVNASPAFLWNLTESLS